MEILIKEGADVNAQGGRYGNALQAAAKSKHEEIVEVLTTAGADVNTQGGVMAMLCKRRQVMDAKILWRFS